MRHPDPDPIAQEAAEEQLRRENELLRRRLEELESRAQAAAHSGPPTKLWRPSALTIACIFLAACALLVAAFLAGYTPLQKRANLIRAEAREQASELPRVEVIPVRRSPRDSKLDLPGNVQAITEAPVLARASGYIKRRLVDIGDRVRAGQLLAEIEAPELDDQVRQARAALGQAQAALDQAQANYAQGKSDMEFARVTAERWSNLTRRGAVSRQENDRYQTEYQSKVAALEALDKAIAVARSNIGAAEANLERLQEMEGYRMVKAPFDGVITLRNVDVGALVNTGSTLLYRIAQTATVRTFVNVPQMNADSVRAGQAATLRVANLPGREFPGRVERTANALDPSSRTLLVEVRAPNPQGLLMPGMYAQVELSEARSNPPLVVPSDALIVRADGTAVAVLGPNHRVHLQKVDVGRDYGDRLEIASGLRDGQMILQNPGDVQEGAEVEAVPGVETEK